MKPGLNLKQSQRLAMTPQLQQSIRLLQMTSLQLSEELSLAQENNLLLEIEDVAPVVETVKSSDGIEVDINNGVEEYRFDDTDGENDWINEKGTVSFSNSSSGHESSFEIPDRPATQNLKQYLASQLSAMALSPTAQLICDYIIAYVNDAGYLEISLEELQMEMWQRESSTIKTLANNPADLEHQLHHYLTVVQSLEPTGVAARSPRECLALQLKIREAEEIDRETFAVASQIVDQYLPQLGQRDYQSLMRELEVSRDQLVAAIKLVRSLDPHPGFRVGDISSNYVIPDIVVEFTKGAWLARLNREALPKVMINQEYSALIKDNAANASFAEMKTQLQDAKWLMSNIEKRHSTILAVASEIVERQQDFFYHGPGAMRPMVLREIAEALGLHESTISRATNGKYMLTPLGVLEFKYFFSSEISTESGEKTSSVVIQTMIKDLIQAESTNKPISDQKISHILAEQGFAVARRTVAKYREQLNIPPSSKRRTL